MCQSCGRSRAGWLDTYTDRALCEGCVPDRSTDYGMQFVTVLVRADIQRLNQEGGDQ